MRNINKPLIAVFRIVLFFLVAYIFDLSLSTHELKMDISDLVHGDHTDELRNSGIVTFIRFIILALFSFYTIQTAVYLIVGNALEGKRTGLFSFIGHAFRGLREALSDPYFFSSGSASGGYDRVEEVLKYRDNKMALMNNRDAAEFMSGTGHVDLMLSRPDLKQSKKALGYMNGKMAFMSNEKALNFMKGVK